MLLYGNDTLVVFFETFRSAYSYMRIGRVDDTSTLARALGPGAPQFGKIPLNVNLPTGAGRRASIAVALAAALRAAEACHQRQSGSDQ